MYGGGYSGAYEAQERLKKTKAKAAKKPTMESMNKLADKVSALSMEGKKLPEASKLKAVMRETISYFSKPETRTHLRNASNNAAAPDKPKATQAAAITLAGNIMEAHGITRDHGFAVLRQVSMGKIYAEDMELRKLISMNAQRMSATCQQAMMAPAQMRQMKKMQHQMTQMQTQIMKKMEKMTTAQKEQVWAKTEPRAQAIMQKMQTMEPKKRMEYQQKMPNNEREALMVYQILTQSRKGAVNKGMQKAMMKQKEISIRVKARLGKLDSAQQDARLEEIRPAAETLFNRLGALAKEEQIKTQQGLPEDETELLSEWQMLVQGADPDVKLRFKIGSRVYCNVGTSWQKGTVVNCHFHDVRFSLKQKGWLMPYQVKLDVGQVIVAPMDHDVVIRATTGEAPKDVLVRVVMAKVSTLSLEARVVRKKELDATQAPANAAKMAKMSPEEQKKYKDETDVAVLTEALEYRFLSQLAEGATPGVLRFKIGQRVSCNVNHRWMNGKVVQTNYREPSWDLRRTAPYQVQLDAGPLIYAPMDDDSTVKQLGTLVAAAPATSARQPFSL